MTAKRNQLVKASLMLYYHGFKTPIDDIIKKAEAQTDGHKRVMAKFWFSKIPSIRDCMAYGYTYGAVKYQADTFTEQVRQLCRNSKVNMLD